MFETFSYITLQQYWWIIVTLLGALMVFLFFVQGGQTFITIIGKNQIEKSIIANSVGRKWEFTFTTLVTFGGAFFASFPLFYSTSFGGAYWVWMAILFSFIIQAVSYEYRSKPNNFLGQKTFDIFLLINGLLGPLLLGTAVGTFFTGSAFSVNKANIAQISGNLTISSWEHPAHGLEAVLNLQNVLLGLAIMFLARVLGLLYFMNNIDHKAILERSKKQLIYNAIPFLIFFLSFLFWTLFSDGFAVNPDTKMIVMEPFKYLNNFLAMPILLILFLLGVVAVLWGIGISIFKTTSKGIWFAGLGTVLTVWSLLMSVGFNNTAYYPSTFDLQSSLTIFNSSSSQYTLTVMSYVSLFVPFVLGYIWYAWKSINNKKVDSDEMKTESHLY
ncbi:MAG: cytochrome d ubiquinol oxidase subunit II [Bacteroidota bacterium]